MKVSPADPAAPESDPLKAACPGRILFEMVTNRWTLLILWTLRSGPLRFFLIRDQVEGISERVLSQNLKALSRSGLVQRQVEPSIPPKVSYHLTPVGQDLLGVMDGLTGWIGANLVSVTAAERAHDAISRNA